MPRQAFTLFFLSALYQSQNAGENAYDYEPVQRSGYIVESIHDIVLLFVVGQKAPG
jgi:hypothetical protein